MRDLAELAIPQKVGARITDMNHRELIRGPQHGDASGAHARHFRVLRNELEHIVMRGFHRAAQHRQQIIGGVHIIDSHQMPHRDR